MFTGRPHRSVNLGSRKSASVHDTLRNAELQRRKRERLRQETAAATTLQRVWRIRQQYIEARHELAQEVAQNPEYWLNLPNVFAMIIPDLKHWPPGARLAWTSIFMQSPVSYTPDLGLLCRLPMLRETIESIEGDSILASDWFAKLSSQALHNQSFECVPEPILTTLLHSILQKPISGPAFAELFRRDPPLVLQTLLNFPDAVKIIENIPASSFLLQRYDIELVIPATAEVGAVKTLILHWFREVDLLWPQIFLILQQLETWFTNSPNLESKHINAICQQLFTEANVQRLFNPRVISLALKDVPGLLAAVTQCILEMFPGVWPQLMSPLAASPVNTLKLYWDLCTQHKDVASRATAIDLAAYWLLVSTHTELNAVLASHENLPPRGLTLADFKDLATYVRDQAFKLLWADGARSIAVGPSGIALLRLLKLIHNRDTYNHIFGPQFWLVKSDGQFSRQLEAYFRTPAPQRLLSAAELDDEESATDSDTIVDAVLGPIGHPGHWDQNASKRVLDQAPFFVPFELRVSFFTRLIAQDRERLDPRGFHSYAPQHFDISREALVEDAQHVFASLGPGVKTDMGVRFTSKGQMEAGIDGGGLMRELLIALCDELFTPEYSVTTQSTPKHHSLPLFVETDKHTLMPNPVFGEFPELLTPPIRAQYLFMGQVVGKCLYENLLVDVEFAPLFLAKLRAPASQRSGFDDLALLDNELYANLAKLLAMHSEELNELSLDFTTTTSQFTTANLKPNGDEIVVTSENRFEYIHSLAHYRLNTAYRPQVQWFMLGFSQIIRPEWLSLFNPLELSKLICGESTGVDIDDLRRHTVINGFPPGSKTIQYLWEVLHEFNAQERAQFLKFVTSVPKPPLLGFSRLEPHLGIRCAGFDDQRLPTASTCVNLIKLPDYTSKEVLREKLLYSISAKAGFDLS